MDKYSKIGIFDSGIGGATVLKEIIKILPKEDYIYYSDSINNPYGDKRKDEIIDICDDIVKYLISRNCKIIVIACNTATAIAIENLRKKDVLQSANLINDTGTTKIEFIDTSKSKQKEKRFYEILEAM